MMKVRHYVKESEELGQSEFNQKFTEDIVDLRSDITELLTENGRVLTIYWGEKGEYEGHSKYKNQ